ncbi:sel1 repeat family protein [Komagataeibacter xylinus]|nr:sel1 repeat family protein [Komagataeibacter xylinus]GBQ69174.1 hypothetical protein AA15237_0559 [Komagataeibacter xylinus NBRC 15237]
MSCVGRAWLLGLLYYRKLVSYALKHEHEVKTAPFDIHPDMHEKSMYWLVRAAEHGMCNAMEQLAYLYSSEGGLCLVGQDFTKALTLRQHSLAGKAMESNLKYAPLLVMNLGYHDELALGCKANLSIAALFYMTGLNGKPGVFDRPHWPCGAIGPHAHELTTVDEDDELLMFLNGLARLRGHRTTLEPCFSVQRDIIMNL